MSYNREPTPEEIEKIRKEELAKQQERKRQLEDEQLAKMREQRQGG